MSGSSGTGVELQGVTKVFSDGTRAVDSLSLCISPGEFVVMVGPSGCGKSTTLRLLAGLEDASDGEILIDQQPVNHLDPSERDIAMVFQDYALYPHMTVAQNIGFSLRLARVPKKERRIRIEEAARTLELTDLLNRKPSGLSGGQRQRVAMGRAIVRHPKLFLLDEPLSNLDAKLRVQMRAEITELQDRLGITTFYVTHDQVEAMTMADRVAVINRGVLQQFGAPHEVFDAPDNVFVAAFMGSPGMNLVQVAISEAEDGGLLAVAGPLRMTLPTEVLATRPRLAEFRGQEVILGIRPKDLEFISGDEESGRLRLTGPVRNVEILGFETIVYLDVALPPAEGQFMDELIDDPDAGQVTSVSLGERTAAVTRIAARVAADHRPRLGQTVTINLDGTRLHFFDPGNGAAIRS